MIFTTFLPLYIDPGTGSMLFSILIGAAATVFFLFRALILKIKFFFSGKKDGSAQVDSSYKPYVIYNEGNQYWNTFKPVVEEFEARKIPLEYLTSSKNDPIFEQKYNYVKAEFIGEGNSAFAKLNMLSAGIVLMTTPGLQVYQLKRSKNVKHYSHVLHMPNDATTYRLFGLDFFDSVLLTGDYQATDLRYLEEKRGINKKELVTVGCPYLDVYKQNIANIPEEENHPFTVLVSPSWGDVGLLKKYGEKLLDHPEILRRVVESENVGKTYTLNILQQKGYKCRDCRGNYIFVRPKNDAKQVAARLEKEKKVLVHSYGNELLRDYLRVSVGSVDSMKIFLRAFFEIDSSF